MGPSDLQLGFPEIFHVAHYVLRIILPDSTIAALPLTRIYLHPTAVAAWVGMFATALNLLPSGQLDGGHIVYALAPRMHRVVSWVTVIVLVYLGHRYVGWRVYQGGLLVAMNLLTYRQRQESARIIRCFPLVTAGYHWPLLALIMMALTFTVSPFQMSWK